MFGQHLHSSELQGKGAGRHSNASHQAVSSREWACYNERSQDLLAAEKEVVGKGKLQVTCEGKVSVNIIIVCFLKTVLISIF